MSYEEVVNWVCGLNCASCFMYYKRDENDPDVMSEIRETIKWFRE